jgi:hypothetical protein
MCVAEESTTTQLRPHCGMSQVCSSEEGLFCSCKGGVHGRRPLQLVCPLPAAAQPICQWPQRAGDAGQESPVEIHHAQEGLQLLDDGLGEETPEWWPRVKVTPARLSTCRWKDGPAFLRPKGIRLYPNRPKGMVMAVFCMSSGLTGIW